MIKVGKHWCRWSLQPGCIVLFVGYLWPRRKPQTTRRSWGETRKMQNLKEIPVKLELIVQARQRRGEPTTSWKLNPVKVADFRMGRKEAWKRRNRQIDSECTLERIKQVAWRKPKKTIRKFPVGRENPFLVDGKRVKWRRRMISRKCLREHDSRTNVTIYFHYGIIRNGTRDSIPSQGCSLCSYTTTTIYTQTHLGQGSYRLGEIHGFDRYSIFVLR